MIKNQVTAINVDFLENPDCFRRWYEKMPSYRQKKIDAFKPAPSKKLSLGAGILLYMGFKELGLEKAEIEFGKNDKPLIKGNSEICFNLSHSGSMAVCAISDKNVGIDIEENKIFSEKLINYIYNEKETNYIKGIALDQKNENKMFTKLWTMKESLMKYDGTGLSMGPSSIIIDMENESFSLKKGVKFENVFFTSYELLDYQVSVCSEYDCFSEQIKIYRGEELLL